MLRKTVYEPFPQSGRKRDGWSLKNLLRIALTACMWLYGIGGLVFLTVISVGRYQGVKKYNHLPLEEFIYGLLILSAICLAVIGFSYLLRRYIIKHWDSSGDIAKLLIALFCIAVLPGGTGFISQAAGFILFIALIVLFFLGGGAALLFK